MNASRVHAWRESALIVGAPLLLAVLEIFHPHLHDVMGLEPRRWLTIHYAQLPLFALVALAMVRLVHGHVGIPAILTRVAMFIFAVCYLAFDTAAGIVTGILVEAARASGSPETWRAAIETVWGHAIIGGSGNTAQPPLLAVLGTVMWPLGAIAAAISLRRHGSSWPPLIVLILTSFGLLLFRTHAWPGGPVTFGGLAIAGAWLATSRHASTVSLRAELHT
jgi:hypothetical protein